MALLTPNQSSFLLQQNIPLSRVYDASGLTKSVYGRIMSDLGLVVAYGVTPCKASGHTLRTRSGHCCQCTTAALAFLLRFDDRAHVYIANSKKLGLTKIGVAKECVDRMRNLNSHGYGGASDWSHCYSQEVDRAGLVEFYAHNLLEKFRVSRSYVRTGRQIECQELFICNVETAQNALHKFISSFI